MINNGKAKVERVAGGVNIIVPVMKGWAVKFATFWMVLWALIFYIQLNELLTKASELGKIDTSSFEFTWLSGWVFNGIMVMLFLLWGYFGKEKFITDNDEVRFNKTVFGIGIKRRFAKNKLNNFRAEFSIDNPILQRLAQVGLGVGKVKFDYGAKTYSFAFAVDEPEANYLAELLKQTFEK